MTENNNNNNPDNTSPENTGKPPEIPKELPQTKKPRKPKTPAQIEASKRNIAKAIAKKRKPEKSEAILKDDSPKPKPKKKPDKEKKEDDRSWNGRFRFHW